MDDIKAIREGPVGSNPYSGFRLLATNPVEGKFALAVTGARRDQ